MSEMDPIAQLVSETFATNPRLPTKAEEESWDFRNQKRMRMDHLLEDALLPKHHTKNRVSKPEGDWGAAFEKLKGMMGSGFLVALIGIRGNGKTQLGVQLIQERCRHLRSGRYCTAVEFFMDLRSAYKKDGPSESEVMARYRNPSLLVIDEIGRRGETEWENNVLYELLNRRHADDSDTVVISNQDAAALEESLGTSLVSRMRERGGLFECNWASFRK